MFANFRPASTCRLPISICVCNTIQQWSRPQLFEVKGASRDGAFDGEASSRGREIGCTEEKTVAIDG